MAITVLKEYTGPGKKGEQDIFIILRPQANNCFFESLILSIIRNSPDYKKKIWLEYLANIPGELIQEKKLMERHYEHRIYYSKKGVSGMTENMKKKFQSHFSVQVEKSEIYGSYEALDRLHLTTQELFDANVEKINYINVEGQNIRKLLDKNNKPVYVINYDIPALMTFNHLGTNSAVLMLRTTFTYTEFNRLILQILYKITPSKAGEKYLSEKDIEHLKGTDFYRHKRIFHYSHGPFEQILDARDFLYDTQGNNIPLDQYTFTNYLENKNISTSTLQELIRNPIITIKEKNSVTEDSLYVYSRNMSYKKASDIVNKIECQQLTKMNNLII